MTVQERIASLLKGSGLTLSTAESCSGGNIAHLLTTVPGSSESFLGSAVSYSPKVKIEILNVNALSIKSNGIVSSSVAEQMAESVRALMKTSFSVSITGWADAYGDEFEPAGTAWIGVSGPDGTKTFRVESHLSRVENIEVFSVKALELLVDYIECSR
ncbi:MAG: CinA family protein [Bacteroidales bacterium]|nr:CinA family protein [Bacteroidales bacterium]